MKVCRPNDGELARAILVDDGREQVGIDRESVVESASDKTFAYVIVGPGVNEMDPVRVGREKVSGTRLHINRVDT